jgi:glycosyltransferase involved in cell wall biosynthesis
VADRIVMLVRNAYTHDTRVEKEARTLTDAGFEVTIVADAAPGLPERETRDRSTVIRVPRTAAAIPGLRFLLHERRLARRLTELRPTYLHAHDSNALLAVAIAAGRLRVPFVLDAHELWLGRPPRDRPALYRLAFRAWYTVLERLLVPRAAAVVTVSPPIARHLERRYRLPGVELVPNYPEISRPVARREIRRLVQGIPSSAPVVLHLGAFMPDRGLEQLV